MKKLLMKIEEFFFGPELIYRYADGTRVLVQFEGNYIVPKKAA